MIRRPAITAIFLLAAAAAAHGPKARAEARCQAPDAIAAEAGTRMLSEPGEAGWDYEGGVIPFGEINAADASPSRTERGLRFCAGGYCAHGFGRLDAEDDWTYRGEFRNGYLHGLGRFENETSVYDGCFSFGRLDGEGVLYCDAGDVFQGAFAEDTFEGRPVGWAELCR